MTRFFSLGRLLSLSDEEAMHRVKTVGDPRAFALLVRRWERPVRRMCTRMLGDPQRAEDLTQETFVRLFAARKNYCPQARFSTYLWQIAVNLCRDELRRRERRQEVPLNERDPPEEAAADSALQSPEAVALAHERAQMVRQALERLPEVYRTVVVLRHYEGLKFREIAEVLGIPEGTVKSRMVEALDRLSRLLMPVAEELDLFPNRRKKGSQR